jgi:four helix bundle protein
MAEFKHKKLAIWQEGRFLVRQVYEATGKFPDSERFALADQLRRAIVSVPSNIAEGSSRESTSEFIHFLVIARGSLSEVDTQLTLAEDLGYMTQDEALHESLATLAKRINGLIAHLRRSSPQTSKPPNLQTSKLFNSLTF